MSLKFKFIPLTFQKDEDEIKKQIRNTIILRHLFEESNKTVPLKLLIESTQYGYNASALLSGKNKFLRISDITDGKVDWETVPFCDCDSEDTYLLYTNDLLIARTGGTTGKSFLITDPPEHSIYAGYLIRIRANEDAEPLFLNLFLNSYVYWSQIVSLNEGEFRPSVNANTLKSLILPKCSLEKQLDAIKISNNEYVKGYESLIVEINNAIVNYDNCKSINYECQKQKNIIEPLKRTILEEAILGKLTIEWREKNKVKESAEDLYNLIKKSKEKKIKEKIIKKEKELDPIAEDEIPHEIPENWVWCRLGELYSTTSGGTPLRANANYWFGDITWYKSGELNDSYLDVESEEKISEIGLKESSATLFPKGTLLIAMYGATAGKLSILNRDASTNQAICGFFYNEFIETKYLFYFLMAQRAKMISDSWGMSQPNISQTYLRNFVFALPPREEQKVIVEKIELLMNKCLKLSQEIETLDKHGKTLMKAMFNETFETKREIIQE
jgi:type I restriction enzyme S subunit